MLRHIGETISMGHGSVPSVSNKQKLKKSSPESKLIGADNVMPHMPWKKYFIEA